MKHIFASRDLIKGMLRDACIIIVLLFITWYVRCLPEKLFNDPFSTVLLDRNASLLGAKIAADGQWRFSPAELVPYKFEKCIIGFEDRTFYEHYGISVNGIGRAVV